MKFPDFIIIGATKCGTTALWYNLDKHPDIYMATKSHSSIEMNFWGGTKWANGFDWYKNKFIDDKICGEKTAGYFSNNKALKAMSENIPNLKLFFCIRNPVDRAYSNFQMNRKAGKVSKFNSNVFKKNYAPAGKYINHIQNRVLNFFDRSQLYICITERMKNNTTMEMAKVFSFLGVDDLEFPPKIVHGQLLKTRNRTEDIELNKIEKFYRVWTKHTEKLTGPLRNEALEYFKPYNERLFEFLGYEIEEWKS